jgi:hypothetical protein
MPAPNAAPGLDAEKINAAPPPLALASNIAAQARDLLANTFGLAALELRLAALSLGGILAAALAAAFALIAFWLMLQAALIVALSRQGIDLVWLLAGFTVLNGLAVVALLLFAWRLSGNLVFRNTAAALRGKPHGTQARHSA